MWCLCWAFRMCSLQCRPRLEHTGLGPAGARRGRLEPAEPCPTAMVFVFCFHLDLWLVSSSGLKLCPRALCQRYVGRLKQKFGVSGRITSRIAGGGSTLADLKLGKAFWSVVAVRGCQNFRNRGVLCFEKPQNYSYMSFIYFPLY